MIRVSFRAGALCLALAAAAARAQDAAPPHSALTSTLQDLGATGLDSIGTLSRRDTGFDRKSWADTPYATVQQLLDALPGRIASAAEHQLTRNLMVSIIDAPAGDPGGDEILVRRVDKLLALGDVDDAAALVRAIPGIPEDERLAHAGIEATLLGGHVEAACLDLRAMAPGFSDFWLQTGLALCRQRAGEQVEGVPALDVETLGPLARIAGTPLAADPAHDSPARLVAASRDPKLAPAERLAAGFGAGRASAIFGETLAKLLQATPSDAPLPEGSAPPEDGATAAALFHAIQHSADPAAKLALAERGFLAPSGALDKVGVAMITPLRALQPAPELAESALRLARLFFALGDGDAAGPWADLATQTGGATALWPYRVLLKDADPDGMEDWQSHCGLEPPAIARIQAILSALGVGTPPGPSETIQGQDLAEPSIADLIAMDQAAKARRDGETVLRAIAVLGPDGPAAVHPLALQRVLADLDSIGMHDGARALALEAITPILLSHPDGPRPQSQD